MKRIRVYIKKTDDKFTSIFIRLKLLKKDDGPLLKYVVFAWFIFLLIIMISGILNVCFLWQKADGWEYLWIAENIEKGHGFSDLDCMRWGFQDFSSEQRCEKYFPTAHVEPIYPIVLALASKIFGNYGRPIILISQVVALFFTSVAIYYLARKVFDAPTGILAGSIIPLISTVRNLAALQFVPVIFAGLMIVISAYLILCYIENGSVRRGIILGFTLGFSSLLYASTMLFIPISVFLFVITTNSSRLAAFKTGLIVLFTAIIVLSAWTIRNYSVFGQIVTVRTGFGLNIHQSNPTLAAWSASESQSGLNDSGFFREFEKAGRAIIHFYNDKNKEAMYSLSYEMIKKDAPEGYEVYNAADRDKFYFKKTLKFIFSQPQTFMALTFYRIYVFFSLFNWKIGVISFLFIMSAIITIRNKKARILVLLILAVAIPHFLVVTWWYRYRYPIEPLIVMFACHLPVTLFSKWDGLNQ